MQNDKILLFIPAYNCEKQIVRALDQLGPAEMAFISKVIVVNNRSTDNTEQAVLDFMHAHANLPITLLRNHENYGLGGSHKVAFNYAVEHGYDYVMVLHGDDQGSISDFIPVLGKGYYRKHDCILGARFMRGSKLEGYSAIRTIGNIVYNFLFAFVTRRRIYDLGSGLNMYSTEMLKSKFYEKFPDNLMFNYLMILAAQYYGHDIKFYPVSWREEDQVSNVRMASQAVKVLSMLKDYYSDPTVIESDYREKIIDSYEADPV
ncbi:MAG: glycosyltransferase family 2 protein [Lachnospiraceae bacterium]|jgi:glycosyltransferase involved in cell wall biosynthesis|nr:glycosyltransferase family 2 protein [Lachnospiraceae bacterium]